MSTSNSVYVVNHEYENLTPETEILGAAGYDVKEAFGANLSELLPKIKDAVGIVCIYAQLNEELVSQLPQCRAVSRPGVGYDMIDVAACHRHGIDVSYLPSYGNGEVASHGAALTLAMHQKLLEHHAYSSQGQWDFKLVAPSRSLKELTVGVIGLGRIGQAYAERMAPFVKTVIGFDPHLSESKRPDWFTLTSLDHIYAEADIISLHCPLTPESHHMFDDAVFTKLARKPILVNVSRGGLVDTNALIDALDAGKVRAVALDVLEEEPHIDPRLLGRKNVLLTPHAAWRSIESEHEIRTRCANELLRMLNGQRPLNPAV